MRKYIEHTLYALAIQFALFLLIPHNFFVGFIAATFFFAGREIAQAEYRYMKLYTNGKRNEDMRWWKAFFTTKVWNLQSLFYDLFLPALVTVSISLLAL
jgi:hypothetical protein